MISIHRPFVILQILCGFMAVALTVSSSMGAQTSGVESVLAAKAANNAGITQADDPVLTKLGEAVIHFIRDRDGKIFEADVMPTLATMWELSPKTPDTRDAFKKSWAELSGRVASSARQSAEWMQSAGIDLKSADIQLKEVSIKELLPRAGATDLDGLTGVDLKIVFTVTSEAKSNTGKSLSGDYVFSAYRAMRSGDRWYIHRPVYWERIPDGVADIKALAAFELENYVAANRSLPPGTIAPDAEVVRVNDQRETKLSDMRGKVVVLDFWATWCPPCQAQMTRLQELQKQHPDWRGRVELVSVSIDDEFRVVRPHLETRGWTNTLNTWAGPDTWSAQAPKAYRVSSLPTTYVIDAQGKIIAAGVPESINTTQLVNQLLKASGSPTGP